MSERRIETEIWSVADLKPYEKNAKKHPPAQVKKLARLIKDNGWTQPIVVDGTNNRGVIVAGHGRRLAAIELGLEKVPVRVLYDYPEHVINALRLADNRATSNDYDMSLIQDELLNLSSEGLDMLDFGFDEKELEFASADLGEFDETAFVEDVTSAVEAQTENNKRAIETTDGGAAPLSDAFGFKRLTVAQSRVVRSFMTRIEDSTGLKGPEALVKFIEEKFS